MKFLLHMRFGATNVYYTEEFVVKIDGDLWPRQLKAAMNIIEIYKECSKNDKILKGSSA